MMRIITIIWEICIGYWINNKLDKSTGAVVIAVIRLGY